MAGWEYILIVVTLLSVAALAFLSVHNLNMKAKAQELKIKNAEAEKILSHILDKE